MSFTNTIHSTVDIFFNLVFMKPSFLFFWLSCLFYLGWKLASSPSSSTSFTNVSTFSIIVISKKTKLAISSLSLSCKRIDLEDMTKFSSNLLLFNFGLIRDRGGHFFIFLMLSASSCRVQAIEHATVSHGSLKDCCSTDEVWSQIY